MRTKKRLTESMVVLAVLSLVLALTASALAGTGGSGAGHKPTVLVGTSPDYPPFELLKKNGKIIGFDIDLVREIAERIGYKVEFVSYPFGELIPLVSAGGLDMAASAFTIIDFRKEFVDFSDPYINANQGLVVAESSDVTSTDDLQPGDTVAVNLGSSAELWATDHLEPAGVVLYRVEYLPGVLADVEAGVIEAALYPIPETQYLISVQNPSLKIVEEINVGSYFGVPAEQYGFIFPKGSSLRAAFDAGLQELKDDGTWLKIYRKWFQAEPLSMP